ncbi:MAG: MerR family transcriptional regulator [Cyclobacteriaceae bacterium]|jgi:DNA-binding transcriptional MerR regulator|nr:MerR family transcriptional regulator [Cyclobacteriaceae bacterium]
MGKYSIKELEQLSGIKAHTIRIWEKRHRLIEPARTQTNIRYYSDEDLKKIINVSVLNNNGVKISKIVGLSYDEIVRKVAELSRSYENTDVFIDQLVVAMIDMEEERFEKIISELTLKFGFERTVIEIIYPFLEKIGVLWQTGNISPAQEHFITHLIRQKIMVAIDALPLAPKTARRVLLYLPENELHELGLLFYHYVTKRDGYRTYYLGQTVPYNDVKSVCEVHHPDFVVSAFTSSPTPGNVQAYVNRICADLPKTQVLASGQSLKKANISKPSNFHIFYNALGLRDLMKTLH